MSKISFNTNISGTGVFSVESPASNIDRTLTLPDESGELLTNNTPLPLANRNRIINGAMLVDQRNNGAAQTITAAAALAYTVDRFYAYCTEANVTGQQVAGPIANTKRYRFTGAASVTGIGFGTRLEGVNTARMSGQTASLSVKLSSSSLTSITWTAYYANTLDTFGSLASPTRTQIATGTFNIGSTEAIYEAQISIPSAATTGIEIVFTGGALLAAHTLTIGDVQLETSARATVFEDRDYGSELIICSRYFQALCYRGAPTGTLLLEDTTGSCTVAGTYSTHIRVPPMRIKVPAALTPSISQLSMHNEEAITSSVLLSIVVGQSSNLLAGHFRFTAYWSAAGITPINAKVAVRTNTTLTTYGIGLTAEL